MTNKAPTLCWSCSKTANGLCPWFTSFEPVNGWDATPTHVHGQGVKQKGYDSYEVKSCPLYEKEPAASERPMATGADRDLVVQIVRQAVRDWRSLCKGHKETRYCNFIELESFFKNELPMLIGSNETAARIWRKMRKERRKAGVE